MYTFVIGLAIFICVLLVLVVLAQNSKGGGLSSQFGGSGASNIIGVKKTGDLLEKLTWTFITLIFVLTLSSSFLVPGPDNSGSDILPEQRSIPQMNLPLGDPAAPSSEELQQEIQIDTVQ